MSDPTTPTPTVEELRGSLGFAMSGEFRDDCPCDGCAQLKTRLRWLSSNVSRLVDDARRLDAGETWLDAITTIDARDWPVEYAAGMRFEIFQPHRTPRVLHFATLREAIDAAASLPSAPAPEEPR